MRITEARLKKIIREEVEAKLILEALEQELLNEGLVSFIKKHLGGSKGWEDLLDDVEKGEIKKQELERFTPMQRIIALALAGTLGIGAVQGAFEVEEYTFNKAEAASVVDFAQTLEKANEKIKNIKNFKDLAQAGPETSIDVGTEDGLNDYLDDIRTKYSWESADNVLTVTAGLLANNSQAQSFVAVSPNQIDDNTILPFVHMSAADYQNLLRMMFLTGPNGDAELEKFVKSYDTSSRWSYENTLYAPLADLATDDATGNPDSEETENMIDFYGDETTKELMLPLEWSVAYDLLQQRRAAGR